MDALPRGECAPTEACNLNTSAIQSPDYLAEILSCCLRVVRSLKACGLQVADAEDLAHEAVFRLLTCKEEIRSLPAWFHTVAIRRCRDFQKRRRPTLGLIPGSHTDPVDERPAAVDRLGNEEAQEALRAAVERIPTNLRRVFELWSAGLTIQQIADTAGVTVGAVRFRLGKATKHLRQVLKEYE